MNETSKPKRTAEGGSDQRLVRFSAAPANHVEVSWDDDDAARAEGSEYIKHMAEAGWRLIDEPWLYKGKWCATLIYTVNWAESAKQRNFCDATIAAYTGHADHRRMQWLHDQTEGWSSVTLRIGSRIVGTAESIRAVIDAAIDKSNH